MDKKDTPELPENEENEHLEESILDNMAMDFDELALSTVERNLDRMMAVSSVEAVFGEAVQSGNTLVIPTAEIVSMIGFGVGEGSTTEGEGGSGSGGGGGGMNISRPVAVVVASPDGVHIQPIIDVTKIGIAALTTLGLMISLLTRMFIRRR